MQISLLLMEEIAKLFAIMLMGYAVVKAGLMKSSESKSISVVMVYLVIPCVIIDAFQVDYTADVKKGLLLACAAAVLVHVLFLILTTILKQVLQLDTIERATVIYSNAGILVIPLVQDLLGKEYGEWFRTVLEDGTPRYKEPKASMWNCPYHNSRMGFEIDTRLK